MPLPRLSCEFLGDIEGGDEDQIEPPQKKEKILRFDSVIIAYFCPHHRKWKEKSTRERSLKTDVELSCIIIFLDPPSTKLTGPEADRLVRMRQYTHPKRASTKNKIKNRTPPTL